MSCVLPHRDAKLKCLGCESTALITVLCRGFACGQTRTYSNGRTCKILKRPSAAAGRETLLFVPLSSSSHIVVQQIVIIIVPAPLFLIPLSFRFIWMSCTSALPIIRIHFVPYRLPLYSRISPAQSSEIRN